MIDADIAGLNLEPVSFKVCLDEGWSIDVVDKAELAYRRWLQALRKADGTHRVVPSKIVDIYWHHHILDTQKYMTDCDMLFGKYIHHFPYSGLMGSEDSAAQAAGFMRTNALIQQENCYESQ